VYFDCQQYFAAFLSFENIGHDGDDVLALEVGIVQDFY
jgi:hypothetical protein